MFHGVGEHRPFLICFSRCAGKLVGAKGERGQAGTVVEIANRVIGPGVAHGNWP